MISERHSGPLPTVRDLEGYNRVIENGAERIMKMAELNQRHRIYCEKKECDTECTLLSTGQIGGFILAVALTGVGTYLAAIGQSVVAGIIFTTTVLGVASTFVLRQKPDSPRPPE